MAKDKLNSPSAMNSYPWGLGQITWKYIGTNDVKMWQIFHGMGSDL